MDHSPFGRLPVEVRTIVYQEVLLEDDNTILVENNDGNAYYQDRFTDVSSPFLDAVHLRGVCRLMRVENNGLYFSTNHLAIDAIWDKKEVSRDPFSFMAVKDLNRICAEVANWAQWLGYPVLRPRSIILNLGRSGKAVELDWQEVKRAVCQFYQEVPIYLWIAVVPYTEDPDLNEDASWEKMPNILFRMDEKERALQNASKLVAWYDEKRKEDPGTWSRRQVKAMVADLHRWMQNMPNRKGSR